MAVNEEVKLLCKKIGGGDGEGSGRSGRGGQGCCERKLKLL